MHRLPGIYTPGIAVASIGQFYSFHLKSMEICSDMFAGSIGNF